MPYELRLAQLAKDSILEFVLSRPEHAPHLIDGIQHELARLAENPRLAATPPGTYGRPLYRFRVNASDVAFYFQVTFQYTEDEAAIVITSFSPLSF